MVDHVIDSTRICARGEANLRDCGVRPGR
jgi:hypothetical protein